jgi:patatin-like phospholipase/acyl hydrolase
LHGLDSPKYLCAFYAPEIEMNIFIESIISFHEKNYGGVGLVYLSGLHLASPRDGGRVMATFRILSIDGGGIRGLITAILLQRMEVAVPGFLSKVDLIAGTSTGGLLALGLAYGKTPAEARQLYEENGEKVFTDTLGDEIRDLGSLIGADYSIEPLKQVLTGQFGDTTLGELSKKVLISSFDLDNDPQEAGATRTWKAKFFHNFAGPDSDAAYKMVDVALYTAVAPTYFPIYHGYTDGGVVANNPSVCALAQSLHPETGGQALEDVFLLSMGTGHNPRYVEAIDGDWGLVQWAPHLVHLVLEGSADLANYQCRQILGERYLRVNPILPKPIGMDRVNEIPLLQRIALEYPLGKAVDWLYRYF